MKKWRGTSGPRGDLTPDVDSRSLSTPPPMDDAERIQSRLYLEAYVRSSSASAQMNKTLMPRNKTSDFLSLKLNRTTILIIYSGNLSLNR